MKKIVLLILIVLYAEKLFSYECRASKDANLYGNAYPFKVSDRIGIIKENSAVHFDSIQLTTYTIAGEASYLNADYSYYLRITTESGNQGDISLLDISGMKNVSAIHELKNYIWEAKYEIDVLQSKDRDMVERFNPLYANYDEWRECTDWQEDKWYNVYSSPMLLLSDSIIYFSDRQGFRGFVGGHIDRIDDEKKEITWTCMESKSNDFSMEPVKSLFAPHFTKGLTYVFTYDLDGDYLTIFLDGKHFYDFVKADRKTREEIRRLISPRYGEVFDEKNITWPRHADGTCDYEEANGNATAGENADKQKLTDALITATENNDAAEMRRLIAAGADVNAKNDDGLTALMVAAKRNSADIAKLLLAAGADMNAKDTSYGYRMTALMYAAVNNAADVAKLLIDAGADIEAKDRYSMTVLMWAAADNNLVDMAKLLLASGADMNAKDDGGMTALMHAAVYNAADMAKLLIDAGADIEAKDNYGGTALMYAAEYDSADVAALLIESVADVNAKDDYGRTALMKADEAEERAVHVEKLLRAAGREPANALITERAESEEESATQKPAPAVGKTAAVTENLRLRTDDDRTAEVVATLAAGTRVKVEATGREDAIDGIASNWMRVSVLGGARDRDGNPVAAGTEGWLFGGYLSSAEDAESQSPSGEAATAKAPVPTIVLVVVGVAVLAVLLAAILLAVRKRKGGKD